MAPAYKPNRRSRQTSLSDRRRQKEKPAVIEIAVEGPAVRDNQDKAKSGRSDRLTRAENRLDALRAQLVNLQMREIELGLP
jgi:hypothetical protein